MPQLKTLFLSVILISSLGMASVLFALITTSMAIEISLTASALCFCLIYVARFSKDYDLLHNKERKLLKQLHKQVAQHYANLPPQQMWHTAIAQALDKCSAADKRIALLQAFIKDKTLLDSLINTVTLHHQEIQVLSQLGLRLDVANEHPLNKRQQA